MNSNKSNNKLKKSNIIKKSSKRKKNNYNKTLKKHSKKDYLKRKINMFMTQIVTIQTMNSMMNN
jgi:hypothetical protein